MTLTPYIAQALKHHPIEAKIVRKVLKTMRNANNPITAIFDGVEDTRVKTNNEALELIFDLDEAVLLTTDRSWIRIILGNKWDCLVDYTMDLEESLTPVNNYIEKYGD
jgi:hypothetical protein